MLRVNAEPRKVSGSSGWALQLPTAGPRSSSQAGTFHEKYVRSSLAAAHILFRLPPASVHELHGYRGRSAGVTNIAENFLVWGNRNLSASGECVMSGVNWCTWHSPFFFVFNKDRLLKKESQNGGGTVQVPLACSNAAHDKRTWKLLGSAAATNPCASGECVHYRRTWHSLSLLCVNKNRCVAKKNRLRQLIAPSSKILTRPHLPKDLILIKVFFYYLN